MLCVACGHDNVGSGKYCEKCNAVLPQMAPSGVPGSESTLDLDEDTEYPVPQGRYVSEVMHTLAWAAHEFLEEEGDLDTLLDAIEDVKARFADFKTKIPTILENLANSQAAVPDDPYPKQMRYLNNKGVALYEEGLALIDKFVADLEEDKADGDTLIDGITKVLDGNDYFCLCIEMTAGRVQAIQEVLNECKQQENLQALAEAQGNREAAVSQGDGSVAGSEPEAEEVPLPVDSTDVV